MGNILPDPVRAQHPAWCQQHSDDVFSEHVSTMHELLTDAGNQLTAELRQHRDMTESARIVIGSLCDRTRSRSGCRSRQQSHSATPCRRCS